MSANGRVRTAFGQSPLSVAPPSGVTYGAPSGQAAPIDDPDDLFTDDTIVGALSQLGRGRKLVMRATHDAADVPVVETTPFGLHRYAPNYETAWAGGTPYFSPDYTWYMPGDDHNSWGAMTDGEFAFDMHPGKMYSWSVMFNLAVDNGSTTVPGQLDFLALIQSFPDDADGWSGDEFGKYYGITWNAHPSVATFDLNGTFDMDDARGSIGRKFADRYVKLSGSLINDGPVNNSMGFYTSIAIDDASFAAVGDSIRYETFDIMIVEETVSA